MDQNRGSSARRSIAGGVNNKAVVVRRNAPAGALLQANAAGDFSGSSQTASASYPRKSVAMVRKNASTDVAEKRPQIKLSILMIAKIKRMAARVKRQYLARHPNMAYQNVPEKQNTYQLAPADDERIHAAAVVPLLEYVIHFFFDDVRNYMPSLISRLVQSSSDDILRKCQNRLEAPRYKLISHVTVVQRVEDEGDWDIGSRCIWDDKLDTFASFTHTMKNMRIVATLYAVYFE